VPAHVEDDGSPTASTLLQTLFAIAAWGFLRGLFGVAGRRLAGRHQRQRRGRVLTQSYVVQWDTSVLSESISLSALAVIFASGIWLAQRSRGCGSRRPPRSCGVRRCSRRGSLDRWDAGAWNCARRHPCSLCADARSLLCGRSCLAVVCLVCAGSFELAATSSHRNVANVEHSLYVRVFPYRPRWRGSRPTGCRSRIR